MQRSSLTVTTRAATPADLEAITRIYNQGIADRIATFELDPKTQEQVSDWLFCDARERYAVIVAQSGPHTVGWAALRPYSHRCAYAGIADLSVYVERDARGKGVGRRLLADLEERALRNGFHKIVLFALSHNSAGLQLYAKRGFREVGIFREQGLLDGRFADVTIMEKILAR
jgi:L-amino acid N-acyltransferase YncA